MGCPFLWLQGRRKIPKLAATLARKYFSHSAFRTNLTVVSALPRSWQLRGSDTWQPCALSLSLFLAVASACVAAPITHLVSVEVIKGFISTVRMWTSVAVMRIETVINVALEVVGAVEQRAGSDENATAEPLGPVVPVWGRSCMGRHRSSHTGNPVLHRY
jgi:hypothetical protein